MASAVFPPKFVGATAGTAGISGLVPAPAAGDQGKFMRADGTFAAIAGGGDMLASSNLSDVASASTSRTNLGLGTGNSPEFTAVNIGAATDTTITRVSAGVIAVEGATVVVQGGALGTPASGTLTNVTGLPTAGIVDAAVTLAKMANLAQDQFIGRTTASTGVPQTATITAAARTVLDDATVAAMVDTLGGASATGSGGLARATSPTFVTPLLGTPTSGTLTNCTGLPTAGIVDASVTLAKMANLAQDQFIGRTTASTGVPETATITSAARTVLDDTTVGNMVNTLGGATSTGTGGLARATSPTFVTPLLGTPTSGTLTNCTGLPAVAGISATGTPSSSTYLRGDGSWQTPGGSGDVTAASNFGTDNVLIKSDGTSKGVQATGISVDDSDNITGVTSIDVTTLTPTTLKITTGNAIKDGNSNELIIFTTTASAVNELTFANAATGANPRWTASGGDTDVGIDWLVKGAGKFNLLASASGPAELRFFEDSDNGSNYCGVIAPSSIGSNYTVTLPNAASTLPIFGQQITFTGPTAARSIALPDAAFTVARSDAAQTFTGDQTFSGLLINSNSTDSSDSSGTTGALRTLGGSSIKKKLYVGDLLTAEGGISCLSPFTTASTTFALINTTATTVNAFGVATTLNIGAGAAMVLNFGGFTTAAEFRFLEPSASGTNYTAFKAKAQGANITYTLPDTVATSGQVLTDAAGNGTLSWTTPAGGGNVSNTGTPTSGQIATWTNATTIQGVDDLNIPGGDLTFTGASTITGGAGNMIITSGTGASRTLTFRTTTAGSSATAALVLNADQTATFTSTIVPASNDTAALGIASLQWSDLFLAEGAVINWDNGDATLTQVGDVVTLAGADLKITTPGTASTSVSTIDGTQTLSNKRVTPRITSISSSATPTVNSDNCDCVTITAQAADITSMTTNLTGTPVNFDQLEFRITGTAARAITWGASFVAGPTALPTTTVTTKALHVWFEYDTVLAKWVCMSSGSDA